MTGSSTTRRSAPEVIQQALAQRLMARHVAADNQNPDVDIDIARVNDEQEDPPNMANDPAQSTRKRARAVTRGTNDPESVKRPRTATIGESTSEIEDVAAILKCDPQRPVVPALGRIPVPFQISPMHRDHSTARSFDKRMEAMSNEYTNRASHWREDVESRTIVIPVSYSKLSKRSNKSKGCLDEANSKIKQMKTKKANPWSARYVDEKGVCLLAVFASRPVDPKVPMLECQTNEEHQDYLTTLKNQNVGVIQDGYQDTLLSFIETATQCLCAVCPPHPPNTDCRHQILFEEPRYANYCGTHKDPHIIYESAHPVPLIERLPGASFFVKVHQRTQQELERQQKAKGDDQEEKEVEALVLDSNDPSCEIRQATLNGALSKVIKGHDDEPELDDKIVQPRDGIDDSVELSQADDIPQTSIPSKFIGDYDIAEQVGTLHLCHAWHAEGHRNSPNAPLYQSSDVTGGSTTRAQGVSWYINSSAAQHAALSAFVKAALPDEWLRYSKTFEQGRWSGMHSTNKKYPLFLSEAIIWKLQVDVHRDILDCGFCVCVATGSFTGGRAVFPDLDVILNYKRGDVLVFRSSALFHGIEDWDFNFKAERTAVTPGRVSHTFFNHASVIKHLEKLNDSQKLSGTANGMFADVTKGKRASKKGSKREGGKKLAME